MFIDCIAAPGSASTQPLSFTVAARGKRGLHGNFAAFHRRTTTRFERSNLLRLPDSDEDAACRPVITRPLIWNRCLITSNDLADPSGTKSASGCAIPNRRNGLAGRSRCTLRKKGERFKIGYRGLVGHVAATGQTRYAKDVRLDPITSPASLNPCWKSSFHLCGEVIGVFVVDHNQINAFSEDHLLVLKPGRTHRRSHRKRASLSTRVLQRQRMQQEADDARPCSRPSFQSGSACSRLCL